VAFSKESLWCEEAVRMSSQEHVLGRPVCIGSLFNASTGGFLPQTIFQDPAPTGHFERYINSEVKSMVEEKDSDRFDLFGVKGALKLGVALGLVKVAGSAKYLTDRKRSGRTVRGSIAASFTSVIESISLNVSTLQGILDLDVLRNTDATHFVSSITWGGKALVTVSSSAGDSVNKCEVYGCLQSALDGLAASLHATRCVEPQDTKNLAEAQYSFNMICDGMTSSVPQTSEEAVAMLASALTKISEQNDGKGVPLTVTLEPIETATEFCGLVNPTTKRVANIQEGPVAEVLNVLDALCLLEQNLFDVSEDICGGEKQFDIISEVGELKFQELLGCVQALANRGRIKIRASLRCVLAGYDLDALDDLSDVVTAAGRSCDRLLRNLADFNNRYSAKVNVFHILATKVAGLHVVGKKQCENWSSQFAGKELYVFQYNEDTLTDEYVSYVILILQQVSYGNPKPEIVLLDSCVACPCAAAGGFSCSMPHALHHFGADASCKCHDVVAEHRRQQSVPSVQCVSGAFIRLGIRPADAVVVLVPCPSPNCPPSTRYRWTCRRCCGLDRPAEATLYYSKSAKTFCCGCGMVPTTSLTYRCPNMNHGRDFVVYGDNLSGELEQLDNRVVIVTMGASGVGKSTFINALANYFAATSFAEMATRELITLAHTVTLVDGQAYSVGTPEVAGDGLNGNCATQKPRVYSFIVNGYIVDIIDSPGIGDIRGLEQDKRNMQETLTLLTRYPHVNAFIYLLNPDEQRLSTDFQYCFNVFVSGLPCIATNNIIFVYVRARNIIYNLGNSNTSRLLGTYLNALHRKNGRKLIELTSGNQFLFENECINLLAAQRYGCAVIDSDVSDTFSKSWQHSSAAARELLEQILSLKPLRI
jgi:hypothetical protein